MRVLVLSSDLVVEMKLCLAVERCGFQSEGIAVAQDMCSRLYRDPVPIGLLWSSSIDFAEVTVREWRAAGVRNLLICLLETRGYSGVALLSWQQSAFVRLLRAGADDVQWVSIDETELGARLSALRRRCGTVEAAIVELPAGAKFNLDQGYVSFPGGAVLLSRTEAAVLAALAERPGWIFSKRAILDHLYGGKDEPQLKIIDVFVCKLRHKLAYALGGIDVIQTVWGRGYQFVPEGFVPEVGDTRRRTAG